MRTRFVTDYDPKNPPIKFVKSERSTDEVRVYASTCGRYEARGMYLSGYQAGWRWTLYDVLKRNARNEPHLLSLSHGSVHCTLGDAVDTLNRRVARGVREAFDVFEQWRRANAAAEADAQRKRARAEHLAMLVAHYVDEVGLVGFSASGLGKWLAERGV